jgi:hypothetical protein
MIRKIKEFLRLSNAVYLIGDRVNDYRRENQSLSGRIRILEEHHEIIHNFLVEINKYLVKYSEDKKDI